MIQNSDAKWTYQTPGEDFPALTEELDEHAFLCGIQVHCYGGGLVRVRGVDLDLL